MFLSKRYWVIYAIRPSRPKDTCSRAKQAAVKAPRKPDTSGSLLLKGNESSATFTATRKAVERTKGHFQGADVEARSMYYVPNFNEILRQTFDLAARERLRKMALFFKKKKTEDSRRREQSPDA